MISSLEPYVRGWAVPSWVVAGVNGFLVLGRLARFGSEYSQVGPPEDALVGGVLATPETRATLWARNMRPVVEKNIEEQFRKSFCEFWGRCSVFETSPRKGGVLEALSLCTLRDDLESMAFVLREAGQDIESELVFIDGRVSFFAEEVRALIQDADSEWLRGVGRVYPKAWWGIHPKEVS